MTLAARLVILVLIAAVPILVFQIFDQFRERDLAKANISAQALRFAETYAERLGQVVQTARGMTLAAAHLPEVLQRERPECEAKIGRILASFPEFIGLGVVAPDGNTFCRSSGGPQIYVGDRPYFQELLRTKKFTASGYMIGRATQKATLVFAAPALDETGEVAAVVLAAYPAENLARLIADSELPRGASVSLLDHLGVLVSRHPLLPTALGEMSRFPPLEGRGTFTQEGLDGVHRTYGYATLPEPAAFLVVVGLPLAPALAPIDRAFWRGILLIGTIFTLAGAAALAMGEIGIRRPMRDLRRVAESLAAGDLSARTRTDWRSTREIAALAKSLDDMASAIERRESALAASEALSRRILASSGDCIKVLDLEGRLRFINDHGRKVLHVTSDDGLIGVPYADLWPLDIRPQAAAALAEARKGGHGRFQGSFETKTGKQTYWDVVVTPIVNENGLPERLLVISRDVTEAKESERHRELLVAELDHRVKNMLASVQSIAARTLGRSEEAKTFAHRIGAMANAHSLLSRSKWEGADVRELIEATLGAYGNQIERSGPKVKLDPKTAQTLGMVFHELATNAAKYGALSVATGRVVLTWRLNRNRARTLTVDWSEMDGPAASPPPTKGFGLSFLQLGIVGELGGRIATDFTSTGLRCIFEFALKDAPARTSGPRVKSRAAGGPRREQA